MDHSKISENVMTLIKRDRVYKACKLNMGKKIHFDRLSFFPDCAFGYHYGSLFEVHRQQLVHVNRSGPSTAVCCGGVGTKESGLDNRDIMDDGSAQPLKECDILQLRAHSRGKDVVGTVVENSTSFKEKTKYSQEKYISKKERKHVPVISILMPSTRALCEMYYSRGPSKICHMRIDTVGQILTYSNVRAHANMIVMETTQGLLVSAMLERMGGLGNLVQVFFGDFPVKLAVENAGHLSERDKAVLLEYPLHRVGMIFPPIRPSSVLSRINRSTVECAVTLPEMTDNMQHSSSHMISHDMEDESRSTDEEVEKPPVKRVKVADDVTESGKKALSGGDSVQTRARCSSQETEETRERRERHRQEREAKYSAAESLLEMRNMDGLVLACRFHPEPLLMALLGLVAPSRPIVVYCHLLEPLVDCYKTLKGNEEIVFDVQISETWTRYYQVLAERTHPAMAMDGQGGYILTATTVRKF